MNRQKANIKSVGFLFVLVLPFVACRKKDTPEVPEGDKISLSINSYNGKRQSESVEVSVSANNDWQATCDAAWCGASPSVGQGSRKILITFADNTSIKPRSAKFVFTCGEASTVLNLSQEGRPAATSPAFSAVPPFPFYVIGSANDIEMDDLNKDGKTDVFVSDTYGNLRQYENIGTVSSPTFAFSMTCLGVSSLEHFTFADLNGDGFKDMVGVSSWGETFFFFGRESFNGFPQFMQGAQIQQIQANVQDVNFADMDGDGDKDMMVITVSGDLRFFRNLGSPTGPVFDGGLTITIPNLPKCYSLSMVDIDDDSDIDILITDPQRILGLARNTGSDKAFEFKGWEKGALGITGAYEGVSFGDLDGDLDLDFLGRPYSQISNFTYLKNTCFN